MSPVVCPYRFSDRPREVIAFLELLGLRPLLQQGDFAVLAGRSGRVAVHPSATQNRPHDHPTTLVIGVADVPTAADQLTAAGLDATWWDEAFGRQAAVPGPIGVVTLDEEARDTYGYDTVAPADPVDSGVDVVATVYAGDLDEAAAFFARLGFLPGPDATPDWLTLRAGDGSGTLGLISRETDARTADGEASTEIGIETTEPLERLADRLRVAGHPVTVVEDSGPPHLVVADPDGLEVEIYQAG